MMPLLRQLARYVRPHVWMGVGLVVSMVCEGGMESATRFSFRYLIDEVVGPRSVSRLVGLLALLGGAAVAITVLCVAADYLWARLGGCVLTDLRADLFAHTQTLSLDFFSRRPSGDLIACFLGDAEAIETSLVTVVPYAVVSVTGIVCSTVFMAMIHPWLTLLAAVGMVVCVALPRAFATRAQRASFAMRVRRGRLASRLQEALQSQSMVKVFGLEEEVGRRFHAEADGLFHTAVRANFLAYITQRVPVLSFFLLALGILGVSAVMATRGQISVGELVSFQVLLLGLHTSMANLTWLAPILLEARASAARLDEVFAERPTVTEPAQPVQLAPFRRAIRFDRVSFAYPARDAEPVRTVLRDVSFSIECGSFVVFVGQSGAGKTSLVQLLLRLYDPTGGRVLFDNTDLRDADLASLRNQFGFVGQDVVLFEGTVRENLCLGCLGATDEAIWDALEAAEVARCVRALPAGLDTHVGERGARFSGGERQRLALARAMVRKPAVLVLDEATSALDVPAEANLLVTLRRIALERRITVIAVSHRLKIAAMATRVLVVRDGRLEEQGSHDELLAKKGSYAAYWRQAQAS